ncbi:hypothetical protein CPB84DRAFT_1840669 [Gymnopilus junonius]|uniref:Uncharacterized protein n=1 Tax=Gymnopilus junonius TaxID=109634 RepID=A0A9P5P2Z0_GYMJU|nr:hypothetical protein CPB84DRAFT_1840669 [Gymnopilus junonius]
MDPPNKRVLTDQLHQSISSSDQFSRSSSWGTPEDLVLRLRSAAARGRKSVLEGYKTTPAMTKTQSTGALIFKSMKDTLTDVYSNGNSSMSVTDNSQISRKRSHSVTEQGEYGNASEDCPQNDELGNGSRMPLVVDSTAFRPVKPLRVSRRSIFETHSVPSGLLENNSLDNTVEGFKMDDEEDWSQEKSFQSSERSFEPMTFE